MVTAWAGLLHALVSFGSTEHTHLALSCGAEHSQPRTATAHDFYFCAAYSAESGLPTGAGHNRNGIGIQSITLPSANILKRIVQKIVPKNCEARMQNMTALFGRQQP